MTTTDMQAAFEAAYKKASSSSKPDDWMEAALLAKQLCNALASRPDAQADERGAGARIIALKDAVWAECEGFECTDDEARRMLSAIDSVGRAAAPQAEVAQGVPEGWRTVPIERSYDMRAKSIIAFNTAEHSGQDRDDALDSAYQAMLAAAPSPDREQVGEAAEGCTPEFLDAAIAKMNGLLDTFENDSNAEARKEARSAIHMFYQRALMTGIVKFSDCCGTPSYCSSVRRCTAKDASPSRECGEPPAETAGVRNKIAAALHYPDHWDTAAYPTLDHAAWESIATAKLTCSECGERQGAAQDCGCEYGKPQCPKNCKLIATLAASAPTLGEADLTHKPPTWTVAEWNVGKWLSAALEDDSVCDEMKHDVRAWFDELNACLVQPQAAGLKEPTDEQILNEFEKRALSIPLRISNIPNLDGGRVIDAVRALLEKGD